MVIALQPAFAAALAKLLSFYYALLKLHFKMHHFCNQSGLIESVT